MPLFKALRWAKDRRMVLYRWAHVAIPLAFIALAAWARSSGLGWDEELQLKTFDSFQRLKPRPYEPGGVRVIDIDEASLARIGQWPWPRTKVAQLVRKLGQLGAAAIAFDIVFAEPDRTSPARVVVAWPQGSDLDAIKRLAARLPDHDDVLASAMRSNPVVLGMPLLAHGGSTALPPAKARIAFGGDSPLPFLREYPGGARNLDRLERAAAGLGVFSFAPDADGILRRPELIERQGAVILPALSLEALRVAQGQAGIAVKMAGASGEKGGRTGLSRLKVGSFQLPVDSLGRFWVYYTGAAAARTVPAWQVLSGAVDPGLINGSVVLIGTSAAGLRDMRATPLDPASPGVDVHANIAEQIIAQRFLRRPDWAPGAEFLYMVGVGLILLGLLPRLGAGWCAAVAAAFTAAAFRFSWMLFADRGLLIDPLYPSLVVVVVYMSSSLISYLKTEAERRQLKGTLQRYLSPKLADVIARHPERLKLGGETRIMTFHFCDIRGFTTISEQFDPHGLTQFINQFLTPMTNIIFEHNGTIDKYMGDCIMAFWNAPLEDPDHAANACRAALAMHARLATLNEELKSEADAAGRKFIPIRIGTGLNTGPCVVGNMGSDQRFDYSVLGDDVNLASRLEGQSKTYGANVVIGPRTRELAPEFAAIELDLIKVKGKTVPVRIFSLVGGPELAARPDFLGLARVHDLFLAAYRARQWDEARRLMDECRAKPYASAALYDLYAKRVEAYEVAPPPADWDGAYTATSK